MLQGQSSDVLLHHLYDGVIDQAGGVHAPNKVQMIPLRYLQMLDNMWKLWQ